MGRVAARQSPQELRPTNMVIDQSEIDALLAEADSLVADATSAPARPAPAPVPRQPPKRYEIPKDPEIARILKLRVPVIVRLATRRMPISAVRDLSIGAIIEFEMPVESPLDLLVNNGLVGEGQCVKVGENFGLRILRICSQKDRIRSLGCQ
jgi:flagellar motor switch protein FliN